jgi:hypothetical protein
MKSRYECFKATGSTEIYSIWLREKLDEWAAISGRAEEIKRERADGWQFPVLRSEQNHADFDVWLNTEAAA